MQFNEILFAQPQLPRGFFTEFLKLSAKFQRQYILWAVNRNSLDTEIETIFQSVDGWWWAKTLVTNKVVADLYQKIQSETQKPAVIQPYKTFWSRNHGEKTPLLDAGNDNEKSYSTMPVVEAGLKLRPPMLGL